MVHPKYQKSVPSQRLKPGKLSFAWLKDHFPAPFQQGFCRDGGQWQSFVVLEVPLSIPRQEV